MQPNDVRQMMEEQGFCVLPEILTGVDLGRARQALEHAVERLCGGGRGTFNPILDPNAQNVRVDNLPDFDPLFVELLRHPTILPLVQSLVGRDAFVSNFTANIALPGSRPMRMHSDQALVVPPPWNERWAINMIWCLDDVYEANGSTRYLPGSHRIPSFAEVPPEAERLMRPFAAPAGSVIAMDGRLWHTSGANVTPDKRRALLFAYYTRGFLRGQVNWEVTLSADTKARLDAEARELLGMGPLSNTALGIALVSLNQGAGPP